MYSASLAGEFKRVLATASDSEPSWRLEQICFIYSSVKWLIIIPLNTFKRLMIASTLIPFGYKDHIWCMLTTPANCGARQQSQC